LSEANPGKNNSGDPISTDKKMGVVEHTCHPSYLGRINRRISVQILSNKVR
jgi:hypothetical protein